MPFRRLPGWSRVPTAAVLCAALLAPFPASAADEQALPLGRNYLTVEGQVVDRKGSPQPGTWVFCIGSRRSSAMTDSIGEYRLEIPGATLEELARVPLRIRVQARRSGWRYALTNGAPELGLEMRVTTEESGRARLRVRSNDQDAVETVAASVVLEANPRALLMARFVGTPGAQYEAPAAALSLSDEITLAGAVASIPEIGSEVVAPADTTGASSGPGAAATSGTAPPAADISPPRAGAVTPLPSPAVPGFSSATVSAVASPPAPAARAVARAETAAVAAGPTTAVGSPTPPTEQAEPPARDKRPSKPIVIRPALGEDERAASRKGSKERPRVIRPAESAPAEEASPAAVPASPAPGAPAGSAVAPSGGRGDTARSLAALDPSLKPVLQRTVPPIGVDPGLPILPAEVPAAAPSATRTPQPVTPARAALSATLRGDQPARAVPICDCTIRGTVEAQSDRPLSSRTEVVISVDDDPTVVASVELFMGSPRAFEIHAAPCGAHRLRLHTRSKQRFMLTSVEPRFTCSAGGMQQVRLVLEPVARWGIAP